MAKKAEVKAEEKAEVKPSKVEFPEVSGTGKFQAVAVDGGFAVYNPAGQRVTGVLSEAVAQSFVIESNRHAHIK